MRTIWQRRPCVIRAAFAADFAPITPKTLLQLAHRPDVESRLVTHFNGVWQLKHGPLTQPQIPTREHRNWTVLVQGLDLFDPKIHALMNRFRFIADARLDDVMASYAVPGGGVGPHIDSYDVFLLQAQGQRRWRISRQRNRTLVEGAPLRLLAHFEPTQEWTLNPGDMLYLPPGVAHDGVALDECITLSIGFRTPRWSQLAEPWFDQVAARLDNATPYRDASTQPTRTPARLPEPLVERTLHTLLRAQPTRTDAEQALLMHLTEPKAQVVFKAVRRPLELDAFVRKLMASGIAADPRTRMLYSGRHFAINGELFCVQGKSLSTLRRLANQRRLDPSATALPQEAIDALFEAYRCGWLHLQPPPR